MSAPIARGMRRGGHGCRERGFTLLEIMIVVSIFAILASIGVPQYVSALRTARTGKAKHEIKTISHAIDAYMVANAGQLPLTLHQVGYGGKNDPWGVPYCYLNYGDGTGDGLYWAIEAGLVDPSAVKGYAPGGGAPTMRAGSFLPFPTSRRVPQGELEVAPVLTGRTAIARSMATDITSVLARPVASTEVDDLTSAIAAKPAFAMFVGVPTAATRRTDRFMYPLNEDYDLFSLGPNGRTAVSLGEAVGQDDVIRANNGAFFGVASDY